MNTELAERALTVVCILLIAAILWVHHSTQTDLSKRLKTLETHYAEAILHITTLGVEVRVK